MDRASLLDDLEARGLVHDCTDRDALATRLAAGPTTLYSGFDPTADSLHVGNLVQIFTLRRFQLAGHPPIALAGGATGFIGDPGGRSEERPLLDEDTLAANLAGITAQLSSLLDFEPGAAQARLLDNYEWTGELHLIPFLRDVGKHASVNVMVAKESVRARMEGAHGISYTEFSYMLLQANDFLHLYTEHGCELQIGGSDQWGNITMGVDLVRRRAGGVAHGLTTPLVTGSDGKKFGKSEGNATWLDARRTSPYRFYQWWIQTDDRDVDRFLRMFTFLPLEEIAAVAAAHAGAPERREGQRVLAREVTASVHGAAEAEAAAEASAVLFGVPVGDASERALATLVDEVPTPKAAPGEVEAGLGGDDVLCALGLAGSRSDARRTLAQGGVYVNDRQLGGEPAPLGPADLLFGRYVLVRRGKRNYGLVSVG
jgi:tyrosyl-tRNA synthetase